MEKCLRKKSVRSFCRDFISECIETKDKDVIMRCSDGDIAFHRFYLGLISPVMKRILSQCPYSAMSEVLVLMPQWTRSEVRRLKKLYQEDTVNRSKLLDTLSILKKDSGDGWSSRRMDAGSGQIEPFSQKSYVIISG